MTTLNQPAYVKAIYSEPRLPRLQKNPLISALPKPLSDELMADALMFAPNFHKDQRDWENHERIQQIQGLASFMVPMKNHVQLARTVDTMLREGYVGRAPRTKALVENLQSIYEHQKTGLSFAQTATTAPTTGSAALIGLSGMGKTTALKRWLATYPRVIHHEEINVVQVPYIHVDMSSSGDSVKALAIAVISQLDSLLPEHGYHKLYLSNTGRTSTDALIHTVGRLLCIHHVGLLVADEVQNLCNSPKGAQVVMTQLVTMCNMLSVPILFIGTNKAAKLLGADFRMARRSTGVCIPPWHRMLRYDDGSENSPDEAAFELQSEWASFVAVMWQYQWVRTPLKLTNEVLNTLYSCTQGILDLAIKLFAAAQVRAILDGDEVLSVALLERVYKENFHLMHEMLEALATNNHRKLEKFEDVRPLELPTIVQSLESTAKIQRAAKIQHAANLRSKPKDETFTLQVAAAAMASGQDEVTSWALAKEIEAEGKVKNMPEALRALAAKTMPKKRTGKHDAANGKAASVVYPDFSERPNDYRRALMLAEKEGTAVFQKLRVLGMARNAEELVPLD